MSASELEEFHRAMKHDPDFNKLWKKMSLPQRKAFYRYTVKMAAQRCADHGGDISDANFRSMQAIADYEESKYEYNRMVANGEIVPDEDLEKEQDPPVRELKTNDCDIETWKVPNSVTSDTSLFFLPPSAIRRQTNRTRKHYLYCIQMSARKRRKWVITLYQMNSDIFHSVGEIVVTSEGELNNAMRPAEFCIDEVNERLYLLSWTTFKTIISVYTLCWHEDAMAHDTLSLAKNDPGSGSLFVKNDPLMNITFCSNFCIRQIEPVLFAFAVVQSDLSGDVKSQSVTVACGVRLDEVTEALVYPDEAYLIKEENCCVSRTTLPELWTIWRDNIVGNLRPPMSQPQPTCFSDRQLLIAPFDWEANIKELIDGPDDDDDDENESDEDDMPSPASAMCLEDAMPTSSRNTVKHCDAHSGDSSSDCVNNLTEDKSVASFCVEQLRLRLRVETRLIGRWDKWLVFQHKGEAHVLTAVRLLSESDMAERAFGGQYLLQMTIDLQETLNKTSLKQETVTSMWIDGEAMLCIQTRSKLRNGVFCCTVHRINCSELLLDARTCATCGALEDKKYLINERTRQSTFQVCRICKKQNMHKNWLINNCHFCSPECFQNGWSEHKKLHFWIA